MDPSRVLGSAERGELGVGHFCLPPATLMLRDGATPIRGQKTGAQMIPSRYKPV